MSETTGKLVKAPLTIFGKLRNVATQLRCDGYKVQPLRCDCCGERELWVRTRGPKPPRHFTVEVNDEDGAVLIRTDAPLAVENALTVAGIVPPDATVN
jgi:hypothetical protein